MRAQTTISGQRLQRSHLALIQRLCRSAGDVAVQPTSVNGSVLRVRRVASRHVLAGGRSMECRGNNPHNSNATALTLDIKNSPGTGISALESLRGQAFMDLRSRFMLVRNSFAAALRSAGTLGSASLYATISAFISASTRLRCLLGLARNHDSTSAACLRSRAVIRSSRSARRSESGAESASDIQPLYALRHIQFVNDVHALARHPVAAPVMA